MDLEARLAQIPALIKELRSSKGMTQTQLAEKIGMTSASLSRLENGKGNLHVATIHKIADALSVEPAVIVGGNPLVAGLVAQIEGLSTERRALIVRMVLEFSVLEESLHRLRTAHEKTKKEAVGHLLALVGPDETGAMFDELNERVREGFDEAVGRTRSAFEKINMKDNILLDTGEEDF